MTYIDKEKQILEALSKDNYAMFDGKKEDAIDFIEHQLLTLSGYANSVLKMEALLPIYKARYEGQDYREHVEELDSGRRIAHNAACAGTQALNRLCDMCGLHKFADINTDDRHEVAGFIGGFISETYAIGTGFTLDEVIEYAQENKQNEYSPKTITEQIKEIEDEIEEL